MSIIPFPRFYFIRLFCCPLRMPREQNCFSGPPMSTSVQKYALCRRSETRSSFLFIVCLKSDRWSAHARDDINGAAEIERELCGAPACSALPLDDVMIRDMRGERQHTFYIRLYVSRSSDPPPSFFKAGNDTVLRGSNCPKLSPNPEHI